MAKTEYKFFVVLTEAQRQAIKENMIELRQKHKIPLSRVLRKVMTEYINDDEFLKYIGLL